MKLTKQGVRDLGGNTNHDRQHRTITCRHVWEPFRSYDCWLGTYVWMEHCGFCKAVRS